MSLLFERYVNSKDNQTPMVMALPAAMFERYVNSKDNQTNAAEKNIIKRSFIPIAFTTCLRDM